MRSQSKWDFPELPEFPQNDNGENFYYSFIVDRLRILLKRVSVEQIEREVTARGGDHVRNPKELDRIIQGVLNDYAKPARGGRSLR